MKGRPKKTPLEGVMDAARTAPRRAGRPARDPEQALMLEAFRIVERNIEAMPSDVRREWVAQVEHINQEVLRSETEKARQRKDAGLRLSAARRQLSEPSIREQAQAAANAHPNVTHRSQRRGAIKAILEQQPGAKAKDVAKVLREQTRRIPEVALDTLRKDIKAVKFGMRDGLR